jgi:RimK-like ATP-grasp domain
MILVIAHDADTHAKRVVTSLRGLGASVETLDLAAIPREVAPSLAFGPGPSHQRLRLLRKEAPALEASALTAVYWRRPMPYQPHEELSAEMASFAFEQCHAAVSGLWGALDVAWMNEPWVDERASHKPAQLAAAQAAGLIVPPTLMTSSPAEAEAFLDGLAGQPVIHKTLRPGETTWRPTRFVGPAERARLADLRFAPAILQAYVAGVDVRVTVVGDRVFAADIDVRGSDSPEDFRYASEQATHFSAIELPADLERRVLELERRLGLVYGALDFRRDADGRYHFLEVNTSGQWLWVEEATRQPITRAVAEWLAAPPRRPG